MIKQWISEGLLTPDAAEQLDNFLDLLVEWNPRVNLTGLHSRDDMEEILVGESILAAQVLRLSGKSVLDIGSGAGIPGLVWAICNPTIRVTSLEVREKKIAFQKEVQRKIRLDVEIAKGLFPDAVAGRSFDIIATRAVRYTAALARQAESHLVPGGLLVRFVGATATEGGWDCRSISPRASVLTRRI